LVFPPNISYQLQPFDIVLIQTGGDRRLKTPEYFTHGCGVSRLCASARPARVVAIIED
jgi:hypothetical protein